MGHFVLPIVDQCALTRKMSYFNLFYFIYYDQDKMLNRDFSFLKLVSKNFILFLDYFLCIDLIVDNCELLEIILTNLNCSSLG